MSRFSAPTTPIHRSGLTPLALGLALAFPLALSTAQAQGTPAADVNELDSVVVTGSPKERRVLDAPYAITVVGGEALRTGGPMVNLSETLARVPGLVVNNRNNYAQDLQISSRGFGARATFGVRGLRLYSDGIPASMPDGQGQVAHFDLANAERVEVLRGPYSVLYGNSSGGVIALFSAPVTQRHLELAYDIGNFGLRQTRLTVAMPLDEGFDLAFSLAKTSLDGFRPQSGADRQLANVRLGWKGESDRVILQAGSQDQSAQDALGLTRAQFDANARQTTPEALQFNTRKAITQHQVGASWQHRFSDADALTSSQIAVYRGTRSVTQYQAIPVATQANVRHSGGVVDYDRVYDGIDARLQWHWDEVDLTTGVNIERQRDDRRGYENYTGTGATQVLGVMGKLRRDELDKATTREAYAQAEWALQPHVSATFGARAGTVTLSAADRYLSNGDDSGTLGYHYVNPVLGLRWKPEADLTLHASIGRGYESPTLGELAYRPDGQAGFNANLQAQTSQQFEFGAKLRPSPAWSLDATAFLVDTENEIGVQTNTGGRATYQNVGRTRRHGVELGTVWRPDPQWRAQAAVSWLSAHYRDGYLTCTSAPCATPNVAVAAGNRIAGTQAASAFAELAWKPDAQAEGAIEWRALGATPVNDSNSETAPGWSVVNLRWLERFPLDAEGRIEVLGRIDNVLNRVYVGSVIVNDGNKRFYEPAMPRNKLISIRYVRNW